MFYFRRVNASQVLRFIKTVFNLCLFLGSKRFIKHYGKEFVLVRRHSIPRIEVRPNELSENQEADEALHRTQVPEGATRRTWWTDGLAVQTGSKLSWLW